MNIREEKRYIYAMMESVTAERRKLGDEYHELRKRLDKLDELEMKGLGDLSVEGYLDLFKKREMQLAASNIKRELEFLQKTREREENPPRPLAEQQERSSTERRESDSILAKQMAESLDKIEQPESVEEPERIPKKLIDEEREKDKKKVVSSSKQVDQTRAMNAIRNVLKESGIPMNIVDIHKGVEEVLGRTLELKNFRTNIMFRANKLDDKIERAGRGFYQYKHSTSNNVAPISRKSRLEPISLSKKDK